MKIVNKTLAAYMLLGVIAIVLCACAVYTLGAEFTVKVAAIGGILVVWYKTSE